MKFYKREDYSKYLKSLPKNYCPFCDTERIKKYNCLILGDWIVACNQFPYRQEWEGLQFMLFPKKHTIKFMDIPKEALIFIDTEYKARNIKKYSILWNNQEETHSIKGHFHIHFFPEKTNKI